RWVPQLQALGRQLDRSGLGDARSLRWYGRSVEGFGERNRADALRVLNDLRRRLSLLEEALGPPEAGAGGPRRSREEVKELLRRQPAAPERKRPAAEEKVKEAEDEPKQPEVKHEDGDGGGGRPRPKLGAIAPATGGGFGPVAWAVLAGVALAVVA